MTKKVTKNESETKAPETPKTEAEKIWDEIKDHQINMFSLPDQTVSKYCSFIKVEPTKAYLTTNSATSVLVALEEALGKKFDIIPASKFLVVSRKATGQI